MGTKSMSEEGGQNDAAAPFVRHDAYGAMGLKKQGLIERLRLRVASFTLFPIRKYWVKQRMSFEVMTTERLTEPHLLPCLGFSICVACLVCFYLICFFSKNERVNRFALSKLSRAVLFFIGFYSIKVHTQESNTSTNNRHFDGNTAGIVSNHVGWADILLLCWWFSPSFVARKETCNTPLVGIGKMALAATVVHCFLH